jgi:hypothetical protein
VTEVCRVGDPMLVKAIAVDDQDRVKLSRKAALAERGQVDELAGRTRPAPSGAGGGGGDRGGPGGGGDRGGPGGWWRAWRWPAAATSQRARWWRSRSWRLWRRSGRPAASLTTRAGRLSFPSPGDHDSAPRGGRVDSTRVSLVQTSGN